jgi:DNA-binding NarL/FixJ family response regulator
MVSYYEKAIRVLLVGYYEDVHTRVRELFNRRNIEVIGQCRTIASALAEGLRLNPHIVLMDISLPDGSGLHACRRILAFAPDVRVILLTDIDNEETRIESIFAGADGYLSKNIEAKTLLDALENVAAGRPILDPALLPSLLKQIRANAVQAISDKSLTPQEQRILFLVAEGKTNREIADALGLSAKTVKNYLSNVYQKLHVTRRSHAAVLFTQLIAK